MMRRFLVIALAGAAGLGLTSATMASVNYSVLGSTYSQNFDSLPNSPTNTSIQATITNGWQDDVDPAVSPENDVSIPGWYLDHRLTSVSEGGFNTHQRMRFGSGSSATGAFYSFGTNSTTDRALGILPSAALATDLDSMRIGLRLTNTTGQAITTFTITYDGEQYRDGVGVDSLSFSYALNVTGANWHTAGVNAVFVGAATFTPPVNTNNDGTVLGNGVGKVADITATVAFPGGGLWQPGTDLFLRWSEVQLTTVTDDGLAIDNVRFSADVPEPASLSVLGLAAAGLLTRRRAR